MSLRHHRMSLFFQDQQICIRAATQQITSHSANVVIVFCEPHRKGWNDELTTLSREPSLPTSEQAPARASPTQRSSQGGCRGSAAQAALATRVRPAYRTGRAATAAVRRRTAAQHTTARAPITRGGTSLPCRTEGHGLSSNTAGNCRWPVMAGSVLTMHGREEAS